MARSENTQSSAIAPTPNYTHSSRLSAPRASIFCLPLELIHLVFEYLERREAANARRCHRHFATIGIAYLVPEVFLVTTRDSFERLKAISEHPMVSPHVRSIYYSGVVLPSLDREAWESQIRSPEIQSKRLTFWQKHAPDLDGSNVSNARKQEWGRLNALPRHHYNVDQLNRAFLLYQNVLREQMEIATSKEYADRIAEAVRLCPRLKKITIDIGFPDETLDPNEIKATKCYRATFCRPAGGSIFGMSSGMVQFRSFLLGLHRHRMRLEELELRCVGWRYFSLCELGLKIMKWTLSGLSSLKIDISGVGQGYRLETELLEGNMFLEKAQLLELITYAPYLDHLEVTFGLDWDPWGIHLSNITGEYHWSLLKSVYLDSMTTSEDYFIRFLTRHRITLKRLSLHNIYFKGGSWSSIFPRMRRELNAEDVLLGGWFADDNTEWDFETLGVMTLKRCVEDYLIGYGTDALEEFLKQRGVTPEARSDP